MTTGEVGTIFAICLGLVSLLSTFHLAMTRVARLEIKAAVLWDFQIRRAQSELIAKGVVKRSSLRISTEALGWMDGMREELRATYRKLDPNTSLHDLMFEIEMVHGERMLSEVCIPHGLFEGACLLIAAAVAIGDYEDGEEAILRTP